VANPQLLARSGKGDLLRRHPAIFGLDLDEA
jgi:hypothetical protein